MNPNSAQAAQAALTQLRDFYLAQLPDELATIASLSQTLYEQNDPSVLTELHQRLHKIAGSGGTFGLHKLSSLARRLEEQVVAWQQKQQVPTRETLADFSFFAEQLASAIDNNEIQVNLGNLAPKTTPHNQRPCIWLVEDDVLQGQELIRQLAQFDYRVCLFDSLQALESAAESGNAQPLALILDIHFPEEGRTATEALATHPALQALNCPNLFITADPNFDYRAAAAKLGAAGFFTKPINIPRLVDRLEMLLNAENAAPFRILIIDDDQTLAEHFRLVLTASGMEVMSLSEPRQLLTTMNDFFPELVLMDMHMPEFSGPELASILRQHDEWLGIPIVYLSAETDIGTQLSAMGSTTADDFLTKPITDAHLIAAVRARATRARQLGELMNKDSLTGLLKHTRIKEQTHFELARNQRLGTNCCVVMIDIDHFKKVNDTFGHPAGDKVIKSLAHLLKQRLRKLDSIGRYGGEEFVAILSDCDPHTALELMDQLRLAFAQLVFSLQENTFQSTLSAGIACCKNFPTADANELLQEADKALYDAKQTGRNRVLIAHAELDKK